MNTSQNDPNKPVMDEVDDLTRFLDEDFGTDEVDLFEFTSGEEDSPLTQLKTIVLGLDWEITDEALQDLADEIENLRGLEQFQHDKVSQVYLQALDKIGNYIFSEGAHAHPNAIKLLMTLFYDFEKITSSELITGAEITALLKADVRKFKILQYQIAQKHGAVVPEAAAAAAELPITDHKTLLDIHAAILGLDWEVSDEGLDRMSEQLSLLKDQFSDNRYIQIVISGLSTLNKYIDEERARTHPEAFTLLHHFFEALETLVDDQELDEENSQKILINCVNRLNTLKSLITETPQELDEDAITPVAEGIAEEAEVVPEEIVPAEEEVVEAAPAEEEAEEPAAEVTETPGFAPPPAAKTDKYVDELDVELPVDEGGEVAPALFDSDEEGGFGGTEEEIEAPPDELEEKLQFFFGEDEEIFEPEAVEEAVALKKAEEDKLAAATQKMKEEEEDISSISPALSGELEEGGFAAEADEVEAPPEGLEEKLAFFFGDDEEPKPEMEALVEEEPATAHAEAPEALFEEEDEEEFLLTPELSTTGEDELIETSPTESFEALSTSTGDNAEIEKIRAEFQKREEVLLDEIASLKQEIESLRSQLQ